jgi:glycerate 2-kinase
MLLRLPASRAQPFLRTLITAGLAAADARKALLRAVALDGSALRIGRKTFDLRRYDRVLAVGAGKASARMAQALEQLLGPRLEAGLVVVNQGHKEPTERITIVEAGHPVPDRAGLQAARSLCAMLAPLTSHDLVLVLLSGGASSLLPAPVPGVTLRDKQKTTRLLLRCGASIQQINAVRKHLSLLKGGGLVRSTKATIATLVLSDVIGDDLPSIGSGPTAADPTTFADAIALLQRYQLWGRIPLPVQRHLQKGRRGAVPETLKPASPALRRVHHEIIGNNRAMLVAVTRAAEACGLRTVQLSTPFTGEARIAGQQMAAVARRLASRTDVLRPPCCVVAGGEPTVSVTGRGTGGRAQEFAVAAALGIAGLPNVWMAALGTDGTDGPTDVAGAVVNGTTFNRAQHMGIDLAAALARHDTYPALHALRCHIRSGPTGTNVNDLYLFLAL